MVGYESYDLGKPQLFGPLEDMLWITFDNLCDR